MVAPSGLAGGTSGAADKSRVGGAGAEACQGVRPWFQGAGLPSLPPPIPWPHLPGDDDVDGVLDWQLRALALALISRAMVVTGDREGGVRGGAYRARPCPWTETPPTAPWVWDPPAGDGQELQAVAQFSRGGYIQGGGKDNLGGSSRVSHAGGGAWEEGGGARPREGEGGPTWAPVWKIGGPTRQVVFCCGSSWDPRGELQRTAMPCLLAWGWGLGVRGGARDSPTTSQAPALLCPPVPLAGQKGATVFS